MIFISILNHPKKKLKTKLKKTKKAPAIKEPRGTYKHYKDMEKELLLDLVINRGMSAQAAALKHNIKSRTVQNWVKKKGKEIPSLISKEKAGSGRPVGKLPKLRDVHEKFLVNLVDEQPSLVLEQIMDNLTNQFTDLSISKTALYNSVAVQAHLQSVDRNSSNKINERFNWVTKWSETDMDYTSNFVFVDEAAFHINMKRSFTWSKVGIRAVIKAPKTRSRATTILGAIIPIGTVNITVRCPKALPASKKRKTTGVNSAAKPTIGTVTGHYFSFLT